MRALRPSLCVLGTMLGLAVAACGPNAALPPSRASLGGAVARVGGVTLPASLVSSVARAKGSSPREAIDDLVRDALAAQGARARGLDRDPSVSWRARPPWPAVSPSEWPAEAAELGPPTDDELAARLGRPRRGHAVPFAARRRRARHGRRHPAAPWRPRGARDDFSARANAVAHPHAQLIVQPVGPFGADGLDASGGELDAGFVAAAFALRAPPEIEPDRGDVRSGGT